MKEFFEFIKKPNLHPQVEGWDSTPLDAPFDVKSKDYLKYAEEDLKEGTEKSLVNSVGNIKRAIDCRFEEILFLFGLLKLSRKEDWNFAKKTQILIDVGLVAPRILNKINKKRNEIEHEFKKPRLEEIEDFFDIANLFLLYSKKYVDRTYDNVIIEDYEKEVEVDGVKQLYPFASITLDSKNSKFIINYRLDEVLEKELEITISNLEEYKELLKVWVNAIKSI